MEINRRGVRGLQAYLKDALSHDNDAIAAPTAAASHRGGRGKGLGLHGPLTGPGLRGRPHPGLVRGGEATGLVAAVAELAEAEAARPEKSVELLLASCVAGRLLGAARTTSCKSAKDRTSVFQTLEVRQMCALGETSAAHFLQARAFGSPSDISFCPCLASVCAGGPACGRLALRRPRGPLNDGACAAGGAPWAERRAPRQLRPEHWTTQVLLQRNPAAGPSQRAPPTRPHRSRKLGVLNREAVVPFAFMTKI